MAANPNPGVAYTTSRGDRTDFQIPGSLHFHQISPCKVLWIITDQAVYKNFPKFSSISYPWRQIPVCFHSSLFRVQTPIPTPKPLVNLDVLQRYLMRPSSFFLLLFSK